MVKFSYKRPRVHNGELRTQIEFFEYKPVDGPYPDQYEHKSLFKCWAKVDKVWTKDLEQAKANGTISDVTITIRDPLPTYMPSNKHFLRIYTPEYDGKVYNIFEASPDLQERDFYRIIAKIKDDMKWG